LFFSPLPLFSSSCCLISLLPLLGPPCFLLILCSPAGPFSLPLPLLVSV
jgi:hypothetical protein